MAWAEVTRQHSNEVNYLMSNKVGEEVFSEGVNINTDPQGSSLVFAVKFTCCMTAEERRHPYLYFTPFPL